MALILILIAAGVGTFSANAEVALANVTRFSGADFFTLVGSECGPTRCMEVSHGTALSAHYASGCVCQCRADTPAFREDQRVCVNHIDECTMATFGRGTTQPQIPFVFLPLKGQIIYPSKEIVFTDVADAVCAVTSAQYLSPSGWVTLRDVVDNDVPFGLYRDEGSTFLQWRGSSSLHARLEGRLVAAHVLCSAPTPTRLAASCAAFRVAGASHSSMLDVRSIPFHAGETVTTEPATERPGLSILETLAICVCVLMLIFVYAAGIIFYIHYKKKHTSKDKDPELNLSNTLSTDNTSTLDSRADIDVRMKSNPLLNMDGLSSDYLHDAGLSDVSEHTEDTVDSSSNNTQTFQKINSNVVSAMVHTRRKKPPRNNIRATSTPERMNERLQRRSASPDTFERAPHSDLSIVCSVENNVVVRQSQPDPSDGEPVVRRKLYFNPVFFEPEHLKNPPPAAIDFLIKIREVMSIAKEKMTSKRFIPILSDIPEEELYHTIDLGWDIPCARRGRRFSAISLKRENSRRAVHCGGCPGCDSSERERKSIALARSNSCKTCVSDDYKQKIVQKWLDEVPSPPPMIRPVKSIAKVSGTPRVIEPKVKPTPQNHPSEPLQDYETKTIEIESIMIDKSKEENISLVICENVLENNFKSAIKPIQNTELPDVEKLTKERKNPSNHATRKVRRKLPPPPPPPESPPHPPTEELPIPHEVKIKMEAVIRELHECTRSETAEVKELENKKIVPKIVIPVVAADSVYYSDDNMLADKKKRDSYQKRDKFIDFDSLERSNMLKKRRFSLACGPELLQKEDVKHFPNMQVARDRLSQSWRDVRKAIEGHQMSFQADSETTASLSQFGNRSLTVSEVFINTIEPLYNNISKPGPLTIEVRGSPVENRRNLEDFDPDTLDRKPKKESKKQVDKILLKSGGSFKFKISTSDNLNNEMPSDEAFTRKIGSLRQIFEAKTKAQEEDINKEFSFYERRGSIPNTDQMNNYLRSSKTPDLILQAEPKPPVPPKQGRGYDTSLSFCYGKKLSPTEGRRLLEERDRVLSYSKLDHLNARRSGRRSARTRSRRTDLKKLYRTEDSGYLSTDSNESKRRARYLMQSRPKTVVPEPMSLPSMTNLARAPPAQVESDTDDVESFCDGRSESGGESVETDSVFFGNYHDSKQIFAELGYDVFDNNKDQIDSGFLGETNIVLSGDSDSEHKSVISIIAGCDGRASAASISNLDETPYVHQVEC